MTFEKKVRWPIKPDWCHSGIPQGNGLFGTLCWGSKEELRFTVNRSDYWYHNICLPYTEEQSAANMQKFLREGDEKSLRTTFEGRPSKDVRCDRGKRLPMGRLCLDAPEGAGAVSGTLDIESSESKISFESGLTVESMVPRTNPVLLLRITGPDSAKVKIRSCVPYGKEVIEYYASHGFSDYELSDSDGSGCWWQPVPNDRGGLVKWKSFSHDDGSRVIILAATLSEDKDAAAKEADRFIMDYAAKGYANAVDETSLWWSEYWQKTPNIEIPDDDLLELYWLGMYRLGGLCGVDAPAASLQGAWAEDEELAPWSSDYHFNINVQECYWPVYGGNHLEFLDPLFELLKSWEPLLRRLAKNFVGIEDGIMLPHAVDDRGNNMGNFCPGFTDISCGAWVGQMMWSRWRCSGDREFLQETVYPFLRGVMRVYEELVEVDENGKLRLPFLSSPEFNEGGMDAYGQNTAMHLAAVHFLIEKLTESAAILDIEEERLEKWQEIGERLPLFELDDEKHICVWKDQPLPRSHRHHSHLAAFHPYDMLEWQSNAEHNEITKQSLEQWLRFGFGQWTGWSFPWASIICSRFGYPNSAHLMLSIMKRFYLKNDHASRYLADEPICYYSPETKYMQIEASMASPAAVMEMFVHVSRDVHYVFKGVPVCWDSASFTDILTEGGFLVSGESRDGAIKSVTFKATFESELKLKMPDGSFNIESSVQGIISTPEGEFISIEMKEGEVLTLRAN